jgi:hypothetical protein
MFKACAICGKAELPWSDPAGSAGRGALRTPALARSSKKIGAANQAATHYFKKIALGRPRFHSAGPEAFAMVDGRLGEHADGRS